MSLAEIEGHRRRIDEIDAHLVRLLNERAREALAIGVIKDRMGIPVYQPEREMAVAAHVRAINTGPLTGAAVTRVFERIIDEARRLEREPGGSAAER